MTTAPVTGKLSSTLPPFAALRESPRMVRAYAGAVLAEWGMAEHLDVAALILDELVANAVMASEAAGDEPLVIRVCLVASGEVLTIEVWDQAPGMPVMREADDDAESGRGLAIIDALTKGCWGCQPAIGQRGKCVWAELPLSDRADGGFLAAPVAWA